MSTDYGLMMDRVGARCRTTVEYSLHQRVVHPPSELAGFRLKMKQEQDVALVGFQQLTE